MTTVLSDCYIDGNTADGMRLAGADDYAVCVYNLRGNRRTAQGNSHARKAGKVFGGGVHNTVALPWHQDPKHSPGHAIATATSIT